MVCDAYPLYVFVNPPFLFVSLHGSCGAITIHGAADRLHPNTLVRCWLGYFLLVLYLYFVLHRFQNNYSAFTISFRRVVCLELGIKTRAAPLCEIRGTVVHSGREERVLITYVYYSLLRRERSGQHALSVHVSNMQS